MRQRIHNETEYREACRQCGGVNRAARMLNTLYPAVNRIPGWCDCCGAWRWFSYDLQYAAEPGNVNFRERMICSGCQLNNRMRSAFAVIRREMSRRSRGRALIFEAVTPFFAVLEKVMARHNWNLLGTEFWGAQYRSGEYVNGIRHEDAARLSFSSDSFDLVISNEVLEHVPDADLAFCEMFRILRPGGSGIITIPMDPCRQESLLRARIEAGKIVYLAPPELHGNPVDGNGSLAFWTYGWDILERLRNAGFQEVYAEPSCNLLHGNIQHYPQLTLLARKKIFQEAGNHASG